ncbi:MAG TPA: helix-turn-helix transcriptional regulator [Acidimicrobiales bacterium]|nr:helix-turn-helix transcriptional regulator [Acidimicrobiales bacterium]
MAFAHVDYDHPARRAPAGGEDPAESATRCIAECLRPGDWICPVGAGRVAVCFAEGATRTSTLALGARLATALDDLAARSERIGRHVTVGIGDAHPYASSAWLARAVLWSTRGDGVARRDRRRPEGNAPCVVVSHLPEGTDTTRRAGRVTIRHVVRIPEQTRSGADVTVGRAGADPPASDGHRLSVLVIGPEAPVAGGHSEAVEGVLVVTERLGIEPGLVATSDPAEAVARYHRAGADVVILPLRTPRPVPCAPAVAAPWEDWVQMARALVDAGADVVAVGAGASVAAIASCVSEGAVGLVDLWELAEHLQWLHAAASSGAPVRSRRDLAAPIRARRARVPARPIDALASLTQCEQRVLYQMMTGASASGIAATQVVSVATVRSHIRAILRKLGVSSQLAAVALANGTQGDTPKAATS